MVSISNGSDQEDDFFFDYFQSQDLEVNLVLPSESLEENKENMIQNSNENNTIHNINNNHDKISFEFDPVMDSDIKNKIGIEENKEQIESTFQKPLSIQDSNDNNNNNDNINNNNNNNIEKKSADFRLSQVNNNNGEKICINIDHSNRESFFDNYKNFNTRDILNEKLLKTNSNEKVHLLLSNISSNNSTENFHLDERQAESNICNVSNSNRIINDVFPARSIYSQLEDHEDDSVIYHENKSVIDKESIRSGNIDLLDSEKDVINYPDYNNNSIIRGNVNTLHNYNSKMNISHNQNNYKIINNCDSPKVMQSNMNMNNNYMNMSSNMNNINRNMNMNIINRNMNNNNMSGNMDYNNINNIDNNNINGITNGSGYMNNNNMNHKVYNSMNNTKNMDTNINIPKKPNDINFNNQYCINTNQSSDLNSISNQYKYNISNNQTANITNQNNYINNMNNNHASINNLNNNGNLNKNFRIMNDNNNSNQNICYDNGYNFIKDKNNNNNYNQINIINNNGFCNQNNNSNLNTNNFSNTSTSYSHHSVNINSNSNNNMNKMICFKDYQAESSSSGYRNYSRPVPNYKLGLPPAPKLMQTKPPSSTNKIPCLYTSQIKKKKKVWIDGYLKISIDHAGIYTCTLLEHEDVREVGLETRILEPVEAGRIRNKVNHTISFESYLIELNFDEINNTCSVSPSLPKGTPLLKLPKFIPPTKINPSLSYSNANSGNYNNTNSYNHNSNYINNNNINSNSYNGENRFNNNGKGKYLLVDEELDDIWNNDDPVSHANNSSRFNYQNNSKQNYSQNNSNQNHDTRYNLNSQQNTGNLNFESALKRKSTTELETSNLKVRREEEFSSDINPSSDISRVPQAHIWHENSNSNNNNDYFFDPFL